MQERSFLPGPSQIDASREPREGGPEHASRCRQMREPSSIRPELDKYEDEIKKEAMSSDSLVAETGRS